MKCTRRGAYVFNAKGEMKVSMGQHCQRVLIDIQL